MQDYTDKQQVLLLLFLLFAMSFVKGQNPFEIRKELVTSIDTVVMSGIDSLSGSVENKPDVETSITFVSSNPFEIDPNTVVAPSTPIVSEKPEVVTPPAPKNKVKPIERRKIAPPQKTGQLFFVALLSILPVTLMFLLFRSYFDKAYKNTINPKLLLQTLRETNSTSFIPYNLWYIIFWINGGIFLSLVLRYFGISFVNNILLNALIGIGIVSVAMLAKHLALSWLQYVFPLEKEIRQYSFLIVLFSIVLGVFLTPIIVAINYIPNTLKPYLIFGILTLLLIFYVIRSFRGIIIGGKLLRFHRFHFLLYICTVELAPLLILIKLVLLYSSK